MLKGFILSESLKNPILLNVFAKIYVRVEEHPESPSSPYWHLFKVEVGEEEIERTLQGISHEIKEGWYAHFWNADTVYVIYSEKVFRLPRERKWESEKYLQAKQYGMEHGVEEKYLDFWIEE
jgi:hypothetical protein